MNPLRAGLGVVAVALLGACGDPDAPPRMCDGISQRAMSASAEGRWLLGPASRYPADTSLGARASELQRSQRARRAVAWQAVARTLAPVALARETGVQGATVPRFQTWYDREDVQRTFQRLFARLSREERAAQARLSDTALDEAFGYNADFVTSLPEWPASRLNEYRASVNTSTALASVSGVMRVGLSPDAVRHLMSSYPEVLRCVAAGAQPTFADGPPAPQLLAREPVTLGACDGQVAGPFFVASGGELRAVVTGATGADMRLVEGASSAGTVRCAASAEVGCTARGPGVFTLSVSSRGSALSGMLDVRYTPPTANVVGCLQGVFPPSAATVAIEWRRTDLGIPLPTYDTSAPGLARRLAPGAEATWGTGDGTADPGAREAHTMRLPVGTSFRMAAMHIRTRELDHWLNVTLWWSPRPDEDFGADRPAEVRALGAPWTSYKMCVATDYSEGDPDPTGGYARDAPTLAAALRVVHEGRGGPSWCSNPYIDAGPGLVRSNCVGCHQHAMSGARPADVQNDLTRYPRNGRAQVRNNFPSDGFWGLDGGDRLAAVFAETVDFWRTAP